MLFLLDGMLYKMLLRKKWMDYAEKLCTVSKPYRRFYNAIKSDSTRSTYSYNMKRFMDFLVESKEIKTNRDYDSLVEWDSDKITDVLEDFVSKLNQTQKKTNAVKTMLSSPEMFFEMNRKIWHKKLVRRGVKKDGLIKAGKLPVTDDDLQRMLEVTKHPRDIALIHFFASTGCRPAAIMDPVLKMKHLIEMPDKCYGVRIYDGTDEGYWAFLTPEARRALDRYFSWRKNIRKEEFNEDAPIFANHSRESKYAHITDPNLRSIINKAIQKAGIERTKSDSNYDKATITMFRKRFNGKLKMDNQVNSNIAEKLMAHKRGLDGVYLQPTREECFAEFIKAIPELTISKELKQKIEIDKQKTKISELQKQQNEIEDLKFEIKKIKISNELAEEMRQGLANWSENNPEKIHPSQIAKADFRNNRSLDKYAEHLLTQHDGNMTGIKEMFAKAKVTLQDD